MKDSMSINIPETAAYVIEALEKNGFEAYIVGGCVRDSLLGTKPQDWDICTSALPEEVKSALPNNPILDTGIKHGTVTVKIGSDSYEVTTFRIDGKYSDNRHPDEVEFSTSLESDLSRRDFTINSMAYNERRGLVDPFNGMSDLTEGVIRCVGKADDRFEEDALRMLRAIRFACRFNFTIDPETASAVHWCYPLITNVACERIISELSKMIVTDSFSYMMMAYKDLFCHIIPELKACDGFDQNNPYHDYDVYTHMAMVLNNTEPVVVTRLAAMFHDIGKPDRCFKGEDGYNHFHRHAQASAATAVEIMTRLKYDSTTIADVVQLIHFHDSELVAEKTPIKRWLNKVGENQLRRLVNLRRADILGQRKEPQDDGRLRRLSKFEEGIDEIIKNKEPFSLKQLNINGNDLIQIGYEQGYKIGWVLHTLLEKVVKEEIANDKELLIEAAKSIKEEL